MSSMVFDLTVEAKKMCRQYRIDIGERRLKRIILQVVRRMEREKARFERVEVTTADDVRVIDYQDPTGESAVRNVMRMVVSG